MKKILVKIALSAFITTMLAPSAFADQRGTVVKFYDEVMNQFKLDMTEKYMAKNVIDHDPQMDPKKSAIENFKMFMTMMHTGFPDMKVKVEDVIADGDKIAVRLRMTGTHKGEFMGMKATNKQIDLIVVDIFRVADGKFAEHWGLMDSGVLMQQLGMMSH